MKEDAIVGYQEDTPASVIFQITKMKKEERGVSSDEDLADLADDVFEESKELLLKMASPDALIRLKCTALKDHQKELCHIYFDQQKHNSLTDFVKHQLDDIRNKRSTEELSAQVW